LKKFLEEKKFCRQKKNFVDEKKFWLNKKILSTEKKFLLFKKKKLLLKKILDLQKKVVVPKKSCSGFLKKVGGPKKFLRWSRILSGSRGVPKFGPGGGPGTRFSIKQISVKITPKNPFLSRARGPPGSPRPPPRPPPPPRGPPDPVSPRKLRFFTNTSSGMARHLAMSYKIIVSKYARR
jgi:hypothetical protein